MTDRLVDIGIRRQLVADIYELRPCDDWEKDQDRLLNDDIPWLIDRVRELEAQAAADAEVVAAQKWGEARTARMRYLGSCTSEKFNVQTVESVALGQEIRSAETQLYAALAAREEEA